jgi:hypothetical protein
MDGLAELALRELRPLARLLESRLLALDFTSVAGQETFALERCPKTRIGFDQSSRDTVAQRSRLARDTAAM